MATWQVWHEGCSGDSTEVEADSFDEALRTVRETHRSACAGRVVR